MDSFYRLVHRIIGDAETKAQWILNLIKEAYRNRCCPDARKFWDSHNKEVVSLKEMQNQIDTYYESSGHPGRCFISMGHVSKQEGWASYPVATVIERNSTKMFDSSARN